jgi:hypothetical protein
MAKGAVVKDIDRGYKRIRDLARGSGGKVAVGVLEGPVREDSNLTNAQLYSIHEHGAPQAGIPARPSLGPTIDEKKGEYAKLASRLGDMMLTGSMGEEQALALLGERAVADVHRTIQRGVPPPNTTATIKAKGSSKQLIDTGAMNQAITYEVREK